MKRISYYAERVYDELSRHRTGQFNVMTFHGTIIEVRKTDDLKYTVGIVKIPLTLENAVRVLFLSQEEHMLMSSLLIDEREINQIISYLRKVRTE